jgi:hypothetical protein
MSVYPKSGMVYYCLASNFHPQNLLKFFNAYLFGNDHHDDHRYPSMSSYCLRLSKTIRYYATFSAFD